MTYTLLQGTTEARALLDEASPGSMWSDAQIHSWLNQATMDVARRAENLWQEDAISVTALQQIYPFPSDFLNCHRAEFLLGSGPQTYNVEYREINAMDEVWGVLHNLPQAWPQYFTIRGNTTNGLFLFLYPAPGATGTLTVYYYRQAKAAVNSSDLLDVQPGWEDIVFDYAVYKALRAAKDPRWQEAFQLYEGKLQQLIDKSRTFTDLGTQVTTGTPQWPVYAYGSGDVW